MANQPAEERTAAGESQQFGRHLSENSMEYMIFLLDESLEGIKYLNRLENISREAARLMETVTKNYVWQREEFRLSVANEQGLIYLYGVTDYGDAVEDEWLIVFVLRELSKTHPEIFVRVADEDGEFLLVEAANALPNWLNPEMDHCRVWIHGGNLKIIPLQKPETQSSTTKLLTLSGAVHFLRNESDKLIQSPSIEDEAFYRLEKYPEHVEASIHHSTVTVPRKLAYLIHELPKTIPAAVEAFYLRDHDGMKRISSESEGLHLPPTDLVTLSVKFSRVLFAQLRSQRFETPPRWQVVIQGSDGDHNLKGESNKNMLALEDGMKLTCGYEILAITAEKSKNRTVRELAIMIQDLQEDGEKDLPTNEDIGQWSDVRRKDDESWLDINYEDFERELEGKRSKSSTEGNKASGFGDSRTQEDLRKIVSRFEAFLNDNSAGLDGAEMDEMDVDDNDDNTDESDDGSDENSDMEDKDVSFDEETFSRMMKEMMGLPVHNPTRASTGQYKGNTGFQSKDTREFSVENEDIKKLSMQMEEELKGHGALRLDEPKLKQGRPAVNTDPSERAKGKQEEVTKSSELQEKGGEEDTDEEIDIDYNLAKNLLESFKSQAGMAGPTGNLLGLMGFQLPRDEDDSEKGG
ncbi:hypothetical protein NLG97_g46 [Lecanicillium saksenae]|uniref:Uncharacterized protein n=1 Tax=Lecanicillium saksenae TaxID=468837 RepID=A0ACC1RAA4_9HYPO|nr:hypothetical protein NLG97_g46 [Lecanicillium saksenae]